MLRISRRGIRINGKYVKYARYVMSEYLGRELLPTEVVHHKDGDYNNDAIENLEIMVFGDHNKHHHRRTSSDPNESWCQKCKRFKPKSEFSFSKSNWNGLHHWCKNCANQYSREKWAKAKEAKTRKDEQLRSVE